MVRIKLKLTLDESSYFPFELSSMDALLLTCQKRMEKVEKADDKIIIITLDTWAILPMVAFLVKLLLGMFWKTQLSCIDSSDRWQRSSCKTISTKAQNAEEKDEACTLVKEAILLLDTRLRQVRALAAMSLRCKQRS